MIDAGNCRRPRRDARALPAQLRARSGGSRGPSASTRPRCASRRPSVSPSLSRPPRAEGGPRPGEQCAPRRSRGARSRRFVSAPAAIRTRVSRAERSAQSSSRSVSRCHPGPPFASCPVGPAAPTRPSALPAVRAQGSLGGPLPKRQGRTRSKERLQLTRAKEPPSHSCPRSGLAGALASRSS